MDPITAATSFSTIVGLICNFRQENGAREALDHQQFIEWLEYHRHEDLKNLIVNQAALQTEVDKLLRSDLTQIIQKLDDMEKLIVGFMGRLEQFKGLAAAVAPNSLLSDQAVSILCQLAESGADSLSYANYGGGNWTLMLTNGETCMAVAEPRFIPDDLEQLANFDLVSGGRDLEGRIKCRLTRNGARFIQSIPSPTPDA
jgi:hypothetical protein